MELLIMIKWFSFIYICLLLNDTRRIINRPGVEISNKGSKFSNFIAETLNYFLAYNTSSAPCREQWITRTFYFHVGYTLHLSRCRFVELVQIFRAEYFKEASSRWERSIPMIDGQLYFHEWESLSTDSRTERRTCSVCFQTVRRRRRNPRDQRETEILVYYCSGKNGCWTRTSFFFSVSFRFNRHSKPSNANFGVAVLVERFSRSLDVSWQNSRPIRFLWNFPFTVSPISYYGLPSRELLRRA